MNQVVSTRPERRLDGDRAGSRHWMRADGVAVAVDPRRGGLAAVTLDEREFITPDGAASLLRLAVPLEGYDAHWLDLSGSEPEVELGEHRIELRYSELRSEEIALQAEALVSVELRGDRVVARARLTNHDPHLVPQAVFPQLGGLVPAAEDQETVLQLSGRRMLPFDELTMRPDDLHFLELELQEYVYYGSLDMPMKWFDLGDEDTGLTVYSTDTRYTTQGLQLVRPRRDADVLDIRWAHYPELRAGETWDSGEFVLLPHRGGWYAGARAYQEFARQHYRYDAPRHVREALAIRSVWPAVRNSRPTFGFADLPAYVAEVADPDIGIGEVVLWHWWLKNGLPMVVDERLGTEGDLRSALAECRSLGVPVSMFVSHHILRDGPESNPDWMHRNRAQQARVWNWTYGDEYVPRFDVLFTATHSMVKASALSPGWREASLAEYRRIMERGAASICFDVCYAWNEPNYSPAADGRPDEEGERLVQFARSARELIRSFDPDGSFSGEWPSDTKVSVLDYTWDWRNAFDVEQMAPFRYVFPEFRLNANVGAHPRGPALAFMEGALLNVMPGQLRTQLLADTPELVEQLRGLNRLRRRFLGFFTEGQYHHLEGTTVAGGAARVYSHQGSFLVVVCNPTDDPADVRVDVDLAGLGVTGGRWGVTEHRLDGASAARADTGDRALLELGLAPDELRVVHLDARPG